MVVLQMVGGGFKRASGIKKDKYLSFLNLRIDKPMLFISIPTDRQGKVGDIWTTRGYTRHGC